MGVGLVGMDTYGGPDVRVALGDTDNVIPFALAGRDIEEALHSAQARGLEHLLLALGETLVVEVAMTVDQPHAASSSTSSSLGNSGSGCSIASPSSPAAI